MARADGTRFTLAERLEHGNLEVQELLELARVSRTKFYADVKSGVVTIEKRGRKTYVRGPIAKRYVYGDAPAAA
jgi:uncharacterized membrane protein